MHASLSHECKFLGPHAVFKVLPSQPWPRPCARLTQSRPVPKNTPRIPAALFGPPFSAFHLGDSESPFQTKLDRHLLQEACL